MDATELLISPIAHMPPAGILDGLSGEQAGLRPPGATHSIVEIVAHLVHWQSWFLQRCEGVAIPPVASAALGWPPANSGDWEFLREQFLTGLDRAVQIANGRSDLNRPIDPPNEFPPLAHYTISDAIGHMAIHNAHHLGQIVTLRQVLGLWPPPEGSYTW